MHLPARLLEGIIVPEDTSISKAEVSMALRVRGFTEGDLFRIAHPTLDEPVGIEPNLAHLGRLIEEVKHAGKNMVANVTIPSSNDLFAQLCNATKQLPASYADRFAKPLLTHLSKRLRQERDLVLSSIERNAVRAVLLNGNICPRATDADSRSFCRATEAAQELASDLYDQFVAELGPRIPRERTTPSLHTWGSAQEGPYTYHIRYLERLGLKTTMVVLPTVNALGGILAWTTYAHEVAGHNLLHAGRCLNGELQTVIFNKIHYGSHLPRTLASYWSNKPHLKFGD